MKTKLFFIGMLLCGVSMVGQEKLVENGNYSFIRDNNDYEIKNLDGKVNKIGKMDTDFTKNHIIKIDSIDDSWVYYKYWHFKDTINKEKNNQLFTMPITDFKKLTAPRYAIFKGFSGGAYTIPIRRRGRGSTFTFENDLSLGTNLLLGFGKHKSPNSWIDCSVGLSITKINLTKENAINLTEDRTASALTFSVGGVLKFNELLFNPEADKNPINFGLFLGWDWLGANDQKVGWIYNRKPWIGMGFNIGINSTAKNDGETGDNSIKLH